MQAFFKDEAASQYGPVIAVPQSATIPKQWILSSSGGSSAIAARFGLGLAVAKFINGFAGVDVVESYRRQFQPSSFFPEPQALLAIQVLCADTEEKARAMRKMADYVLLQFEKGNFTPIGAYEEIKDYRFSMQELERIHMNSGRVISGTPDNVKEQLLQLANDFNLEEIMVSCMSFSHEDRVRSFELLAEAFELTAVSDQLSAVGF